MQYYLSIEEKHFESRFFWILLITVVGWRNIIFFGLILPIMKTPLLILYDEIMSAKKEYTDKDIDICKYYFYSYDLSGQEKVELWNNKYLRLHR